MQLSALGSVARPRTRTAYTRRPDPPPGAHFSLRESLTLKMRETQTVRRSFVTDLRTSQGFGTLECGPNSRVRPDRQCFVLSRSPIHHRELPEAVPGAAAGAITKLCLVASRDRRALGTRPTSTYAGRGPVGPPVREVHVRWVQPILSVAVGQSGQCHGNGPETPETRTCLPGYCLL